jgi:hypothetical protein
MLEVFIPVSGDEELAITCIDRLLMAAQRTNNIMITIGISDLAIKWKSSFNHLIESRPGIARIIEHQGRVWLDENFNRLWKNRIEADAYMLVSSNLIPEVFDPFGDSLAIWNLLISELTIEKIGFLSIPVADSNRWFPDHISYMTLRDGNDGTQRFFTNPINGILEEKVLVFSDKTMPFDGIQLWPLTNDAHQRGLASWTCSKKIFSEARFF